MVVGVGVVVALCQLIYYVSVLYPNTTSGWAEALKAITGSGNGAASQRRPNMRGLIQADATGDSERVQEVLDKEEEDSAACNERRLGDGRNDRPRVEVSPLLDGWRGHGGHGTRADQGAHFWDGS